MKKAQIIIFGITFLPSAILAAPLPADTLYPASVNLTTISTNSNGHLTYKELGNSQIIRAAAASAAITNLSSLRLVYDATADMVEVVQGTNNAVISATLTFDNQTYFGSTNQSVERFASVEWGTNTVGTGTALISETRWHGTPWFVGGFLLQGDLQFIAPASGTNAPVIYSGSVTASSFGGIALPLEK